MRSIIVACTLFIAVSVFIAHYADELLVNPRGRSDADAMTTTRSDSMKIVTAPRPDTAPSANPRSRSQSQMPQVITTLSTSTRSVTIRDDGSGHFKTEARVVGQRVEFLVDTGASAVVLRASTAARLGIHPAARDYNVKVTTANGESRAALVQLDSIEVGEITVRDVRALVQSDEQLPMNLLGMTFLSRVRWNHDRGKLVLEQ